MRYGKKYYEKMMRHKKEYLIDLLVSALKREEKRTSKGNRALHLFFNQMAEQFNNQGLDCTIEVQGMVFISPYTGTIFKEQIWRPVMKALYGIDSTTELTHKQIDGVLEVLAASFAHTQIDVHFPSKWDLIIKEYEKRNLI